MERCKTVHTSWKLWEIALYIALFAAIISGAVGAQAAANAPLDEKLIRLHVVAASDSVDDQALKLRVRDEVLTYLQAPLSGAAEQQTAAESINALLPALQTHLQAFVAAEGSEQAVTVSLEREAFPTRHYDSFSLPAGPYTALRIVLDEGAGQNWWCVVFPPLCTSASLQELGRAEIEALGLREEDIALITMEDQSYVVKFKVLEWWGAIKNLFSK